MNVRFGTRKLSLDGELEPIKFFGESPLRVSPALPDIVDSTIALHSVLRKAADESVGAVKAE